MIILIIGLGSIARKHIEAINEVDHGSTIYALRSAIDADIYHNVNNIFSLSELPATPDFIIISNPTQLHEKAILSALNIGCPLFIEKPFLADLTNIESIITEIKNRKVITYVACNMRFHPALQFLRQYITTEKPGINEVNVYCGSYLPDWRPGRDYRIIYSAIPELGGGVHLDLIHEIDYCNWIFGKPERVKAIRRNKSSLHIQAIDYAHYILIYDRFVTNITLNYYRIDTKRTVEILFDNSTWIIDLLTCEIKDNKDNVIFKKDYKIVDSYTTQMRYFMNAILEKKPLMNDAIEATEILKICLTNE